MFSIQSFQVAISTESRKVLETSCFEQALNQIWYNKLSLSNNQLKAKVSLILPLATLGFTAPWLVKYRDPKAESREVKPSFMFLFDES